MRREKTGNNKTQSLALEATIYPITDSFNYNQESAEFVNRWRDFGDFPSWWRFIDCPPCDGFIATVRSVNLQGEPILVCIKTIG